MKQSARSIPPQTRQQHPRPWRALGLLVTLVAGLGADSAFAQFVGGDGSRANPYQIATAAQLDEIRHHLDKHFLLVSNIDMGGMNPDGQFWNDGAGWLPIGWETLQTGALVYRPFTGSLDGDLHTIRNLYINRPESQGYVGLFSALQGGELRDVGLIDITVHGNYGVGGLTGFNAGALVNVAVKGRLTGQGFVGPLAGYNYGALIGTEKTPILLENSQIGIGTTLEYVTVGAQNNFETGADVSKEYIARLGRGVRFQANGYIPSGIDLSPALPTLAWPGKDGVKAIDLRGDVLVAEPNQTPPGVLDAVNALPEYNAGQLRQSLATGELTIATPGALSRALPVRVMQSGDLLPPGTYRTANGDLLIITETRRAVISWPLLLDLPLFQAQVQGRGLTPEVTANGDLRVATPGGAYYMARPHAAIVAPGGVSTPGLVSRLYAGMANVAEHLMILRAEDGTLMEQPLVPRPASWAALEAGLLKVPQLSDPLIDADGTISVVLRGVERKGRLSYRVTPGKGATGVSFAGLALAGDLNVDGTQDYLVTYPNGDQQVLFVYPF